MPGGRTAATRAARPALTARAALAAVAALAAGAACRAPRSTAPTAPVAPIARCSTEATAPTTAAPTAEPAAPADIDAGTPEAAAAAVPGLASLDGVVPRAIHVLGASPTLTRELEAALELPADQPLAIETLREALTRVWRLGVIDDLAVTATPVGDGVELAVRVHPRPLIGRVEVVGDDATSVPLLRAAAGAIHDPARVERLRTRSIEALHDAGYRHAAVAVATRAAADGAVDLCVAVSRGRRYRIDRIVVDSAGTLDAATLRAALGRPVGAINVVGGVLRDDVLALDLARLQLAYLDAGHVEVKVGEPVATEDPRRGLVRVVIPVEAGPRYRIGAVVLSGALDGQAGARRHLDQHGLRTGAWFSRREASLAVDELRAAYPRASVFVSSQIDTDKAVVDLTFEGSQ